MTSGWPAWPTKMMWRPALISRSAWRWTLRHRAPELPEGTVIAKHALRNALLPVITIAGLQFGSMLSGAIITEKAFARPGIGLLLVDSIAGATIRWCRAACSSSPRVDVLVNILVDLAYGLADPRIRRA